MNNIHCCLCLTQMTSFQADEIRTSAECLSQPQLTYQSNQHSITVSCSVTHLLPIVRSEKLGSGHSQDVFPFKRSLLLLRTCSSMMSKTTSSSLRWGLGEQIQKIGHCFLDAPFCSSIWLFNIILPRKPQWSLCMLFLKHLRSSEGWQKKMFHFNISRDLLFFTCVGLLLHNR